jgi:predicted RNase H-like HicB family nuclease
MSAYIGIIHKEPASCYGVSFPDFPGCITAGDTMQGAMQAASEVLGAHIRWMREDGDTIPAPSTLDLVMADPDFADGVPFLVTPGIQLKGKAIRLNVTLDEHLVSEIDARAVKLGMSRSAFLAEAARRALHS